ncbi:MAG TPA: Rieske (2Fe-2S) protein, partial [Alphaproteobacteria bacterium]|nr:Rieske (2Fe-2S) protein [Alphaproteobacteria bacterium]
MAPHRSSFRLERGRFNSDPARSYTLPAEWYTEPAVFEAEKESIFYRTWQFAGHAGQLANPGDYVTSPLLDQNVFIVRGTDGILRAFHNVCRHRAHQLLQGSGNVRVITCPYHAWSYELDGRLRAARGHETVAGFDRSEFCLSPI